MTMQITLKEWRKQNNVEDEESFFDILKNATFDGMCPVLCDECDDVEPDGHCAHGGQSILIAAGLI